MVSVLWWLSLNWTPQFIHVMPTNGKVFELFIIMLIIVPLFNPNRRGAFTPKYHTSTYSSVIEQLLI